VLTFVKLHVLCPHRGYKKSSTCVISGTLLSISVDNGVRSIIEGLNKSHFLRNCLSFHLTVLRCINLDNVMNLKCLGSLNVTGQWVALVLCISYPRENMLSWVEFSVGAKEKVT
jgi:hypothetical protein